MAFSTFRFEFKGNAALLNLLSSNLGGLDQLVMENGLGSEFRSLPAMFYGVVSDSEYDLIEAENLVYEYHLLGNGLLKVYAHGTMSDTFLNSINSCTGLGVRWEERKPDGEYFDSVIFPNDLIQDQVMSRLGLTPVEVKSTEAAKLPCGPCFSIEMANKLLGGHCGLAIHTPSKRFHLYTFNGKDDVFNVMDLGTGISLYVHSDSVKDEMILLPYSERLNEFLCHTLYRNQVADGELAEYVEALELWVEPELFCAAVYNLV